MTKKRMKGYTVPLGWGKTEDERTWGRAAQVVAAQMRDGTVRGQHKDLIQGGGNVNDVGNWPRQFEPEMAMSCRGCAPQDHLVIAKDEEKKGPRASKEKVTCEKCKHVYPSRDKYDRHIESAKACVQKEKAMQGNPCYKECAKQDLLGKKKARVAQEPEPAPKKGEKKTKKPEEKKPVERRPCTGLHESLDHVLNKCEKMKGLFGDTFGWTFKQKVDKMVKIRDHFKLEREEAHKAKRRNATSKVVFSLPQTGPLLDPASGAAANAATAGSRPTPAPDAPDDPADPAGHASSDLYRQPP